MWKIVIFLLYLTGKAITKELKSLQEISALRKNGTHIGNEKELLNKINKMIVQGLNHTQIVTDFDGTLTVDKGVDGKTALNSFEMFRMCPSVPQSYKEEDFKLYLKYKSVESDLHMSTEDKSQLLNEWYKASHNLMKGLKFPRQELKNIARNVRNGFRERMHELMLWINDKEVPLLVLSSGLGEAVVDTLEAANLTSPQLKVVSNFLEIDSEDIITGMKGNIIHSFNKNQAIDTIEYFKETKRRNNVILMGDSLGDASMVDGLDFCDTVIKIGFLSTERSTYLSEYINSFDIVLLNDQTIDAIIDIVNLLHC